jgi:hypothetical protein
MTGVPAPYELTPVPPGHILLHIGPYKTGSTALQSALFARREELAAYGVAYPGRWRRLFRQGHALMGWAPRGHEVPPESVWDDFAAEVRAVADRGEQRVCLSTEDFGRLRRHSRSEKIAADLGAERLHVVAVARAYHRLLPSHWQERVKSHETRSYDAWLHELLEGDETDEAHRSFWTSHDVEWMASMWLDVIGPDRFTLVVTDDTDHSLLPHTVESMLGLPAGMLASDQVSNASLSRNAVEMLRRLNEEFERHGWSERDYTRLVQQGMVPALQEAGRQGDDVGGVPLPSWAQPLVAERSARRIKVIESLGVRVVGDLDCLRLPEQPTVDEPAPGSVSVAAAATALGGVVGAALAQPSPTPSPKPSPKPGERRPGKAPAVAATSSRDLLGEVWRRQRRRFRPRARRG